MKKSYFTYITILVILLAGTFGLFSTRWDLTQEQRYTLS